MSAARVVILASLCLLSLAPHDAHAQVAAIGGAGAPSLRARGVDAASGNPATLAWDHATAARVVSAAASIGNNSFSTADYRRWNGAAWSESDRRAILDRIPGSALEGRFDFEAGGPAIAGSGWAASVHSRAAGEIRIPRELARLVLFGNDPERTFSLDAAGGSALAWSELRVSHGREVASFPILAGDAAPTHFYAGLTAKALRGWAYAEVVEASGGLETTLDGIHGEARVGSRTARGGTGYGADLGLAARHPSGWDFGLAVRDVAAAIRWTGRPEYHTWRATADSLELRDFEDADDGSDLVHEESETVACGAFRTTMPAVVSLAAARTTGGYHIEVDLSRAMRDGPAASAAPRLALGGSREYFGFLEPRAGVALGGAERMRWGAGLGLRALHLEIDLALATTSWFFAPRGISGGVAFGFRPPPARR